MAVKRRGEIGHEMRPPPIAASSALASGTQLAGHQHQHQHQHVMLMDVQKGTYCTITVTSDIMFGSIGAPADCVQEEDPHRVLKITYDGRLAEDLTAAECHHDGDTKNESLLTILLLFQLLCLLLKISCRQCQ
jgi:hypothetical protein